MIGDTAHFLAKSNAVRRSELGPLFPPLVSRLGEFILYSGVTAPTRSTYSSGIKLFLFRRTFYDLSGFYALLIVLYLFPTGVLYFVFLDLLDVLLNIYRWILLIVFGWDLLQITKLEETLGMNVKKITFACVHVK